MENRSLYFSFISNDFVKNEGIMGLSIMSISSFYVSLFERSFQLKHCKLINMNLCISREILTALTESSLIRRRFL